MTSDVVRIFPYIVSVTYIYNVQYSTTRSHHHDVGQPLATSLMHLMSSSTCIPQPWTMRDNTLIAHSHAAGDGCCMN